jgi:hypothetical protein
MKRKKMMETAICVNYDRLLHGEKGTWCSKCEKLTTKFLKKCIYYGKSRHAPSLQRRCES